MGQTPIFWGEEHRGTLRAETRGLYTTFDARCRLPDRGLWCVWAVGDRGELRIGVAEPQGDQAGICRRFSIQQTACLGSLQKAVLRPAGEQADRVDWEPLTHPEQFRTPWLRGQLSQLSGVRIARGEGVFRLAVPWDPAKPFPLTQLFCLATLRQLEGQWALIFTFDQQETPIFGDERRI